MGKGYLWGKDAMPMKEKKMKLMRKKMPKEMKGKASKMSGQKH
jgi:hypothetical protein